MKLLMTFENFISDYYTILKNLFPNIEKVTDIDYKLTENGDIFYIKIGNELNKTMVFCKNLCKENVKKCVDIKNIITSSLKVSENTNFNNSFKITASEFKEFKENNPGYEYDFDELNSIYNVSDGNDKIAIYKPREWKLYTNEKDITKFKNLKKRV